MTEYDPTPTEDDAAASAGPASAPEVAGPRRRRAPRAVRWALLGLAGLAAVLAIYAGWTTFWLWQSWRSIDRVAFDLEESRAALEGASPSSSVPAADGQPSPPTPVPDELFDAFVVVGTDGRPSADSERADAVLLFLKPASGSRALLTSLPRDLLVHNPCAGAPTPLYEALAGCAPEVSGPELLALTVERFTGVPVDHFAVLGFQGFVEIVDALGGVRVCVDHPVRLSASSDELLPAGCTEADGPTALAWVRSRTLEERVDDQWQLVEGGDASRVQRQQELLIELLRELRGVRSPQRLSGIAADLGDLLILDESLSLAGAVGLAWDARTIGPEDIVRPVVPAASEVTADGAFVVVPQQSFTELLVQVFPDLAGQLGS